MYNITTKKTLIMVSILTLLLIGGIYAGVTLVNTKTDLTFTKDEKAVIDKYKVSSLKLIEYECEGEYTRCYNLIGTNIKRTGFLKMSERVCSQYKNNNCIKYRMLTDKEIDAIKDKAVANELKELVELNKPKVKKEIKYGERTYNITEK